MNDDGARASVGGAALISDDYGGVVAMPLLTMRFGWALPRSTERPLNPAVQLAGSVGAGDLVLDK